MGPKPRLVGPRLAGLDAGTVAGTKAGGAAAGAADGPSAADVVILDDADLGFRAAPGLWPAALRVAGKAATGAATPKESARPWVILKMTCPVASGDL